MTDAMNDGSAGGIDLNTATMEELVASAGLAQGDAEALVRGRPYESWSDVGRLAHLDADLVNGLKSRGVTLGVPTEGPIGEPGSGGSAGSAAGNLGRA